LGLDFWAGGFYDGRLPKPVAMEVGIVGPGKALRAAEQDAAIARPAPAPAVLGSADETLNVTLPPLVTGQVRSLVSVNGTLKPLDLTMDGKLVARELTVAQHDFGDANVDVRGTIGAQQISFVTSDAILFRGKWKLNGKVTYPNDARFVLGVQDLSM